MFIHFLAESMVNLAKKANNGATESREIPMFVYNQMAKSREILMFVCLQKDAK